MKTNFQTGISTFYIIFFEQMVFNLMIYEAYTMSHPCIFFALQLIEEHACRWQTPLPQLRILEIALCYFAQASTVLPSSCDHVIHTLSSLECHSSFAKHQNIHLLQLERLLQGGGVWAFPALQAILSDASLPQNEVDGCITSEPPVFFELRVRYLLSCKRIKEATALSRCCAQHPTAGRHSFFLQVYLTSLYKTSQLELLLAEVSGFNGKDAVNIICALEFEESDELLLSLSRVFLSEQLRRGDCLKYLHNRLNTPKPPFLEESRKLMSSATNVCSIFPFIRAILQEMGEDGIQFCVELCANALQSFPDSDVTTKSLIYKTIAALVPNDLEVCRACALLVFFLERSVDSYKTVYLLYMLPDQQYHVDSSSIGNQVRFETLQILKKDLYFDPEFWNLIALRTNFTIASPILDKVSKAEVLPSLTAEVNLKQAGEKIPPICDQIYTKQDVGLDPFEDDDDFGEDEPESEESKLEFCCTFCNKNFKGCRVVKHAMCHYRRDECMFCGTMFKDDLLAMMHLSNHIETLKKIIKKETVSNDAKGKASPQTKEMPLSEPLVSSERRKRGRPRKIANCLKSSQSVISVESRKLRSYKEEDGSSSQEQSRSGRTPIHKLNGHIRKKKEMKKLRSGLKVKATLAQQDSRNESKRSDLVNHRLVEHQSNSTDSSATSHQVDKRLPGSVEENKKTVKAPQRLKMVAKQKRKLKEKPNAPKERVCCPMNGCQWFTDLSKNRVALLYHALDEHSGQVKPLELAFRIAKSRCSICMRVLWSFEHFQHHIEQHRRTPRYPCLHQGCTARFKTGNEMRRHTRKHSPLQAVCCVPGCPKLFICLWALNLHERDHYSKKSSKTNKNSHQQKDYKCDPKQNQTVKDSKDRTDEARTAKAESDQKEQMMHQSTKVKQVEVPSLSDKQKEDKGEKDATLSTGGQEKEESQTPACESSIPAASYDLNAKTELTTTCLNTVAVTNEPVLINGVTPYVTQASLCMDVLEEYNKKPYRRLPPTAYLAEMYTTMPKRRKELSWFSPRPKSSPPSQQRTSSALQRQRCATCFTTFTSTEELQSHLQTQRCSKLFGFDSDEES
uniref:C2H2-type domain-containing protein n=1 Tax=Gouania willdenowi TaxID=441366 RepID=A0A8C5GCJ6_GOUWI